MAGARVWPPAWRRPSASKVPQVGVTLLVVRARVALLAGHAPASVPGRLERCNPSDVHGPLGPSARARPGAASVERVFVLGIDPGVSRCGYGVVEHGPGGSCGRRRSACCAPPPACRAAQRLAELRAELRRPAREFRPDAVAVERVLFQATSAPRCRRPGLRPGRWPRPPRAASRWSQYSPNEVKEAVAGYGAADKDQVQRMVQTLLGLDAPPRPADAADAAGRWPSATSPASPTRPPPPRPAAGQPGDAVIGSLRGTVLDRAARGEVLVEVGGVGYRRHRRRRRR